MYFTVKSILSALVGATAVSAQCAGPPANAATVSLIAEFEGFRPNIYLDPAGLATVGYGHLCDDSSCSDVPYPIPLSKADGRKLLRSDMSIAQDCITLQVDNDVTLNSNRYGALVSWAFNVGCGASGSSALIARLNNEEDKNTVVEQELPRWNSGGGVVLPGLVRRRKAEVELFQTPTDEPALPGCA